MKNIILLTLSLIIILFSCQNENKENIALKNNNDSKSDLEDIKSKLLNQQKSSEIKDTSFTNSESKTEHKKVHKIENSKLIAKKEKLKVKKEKIIEEKFKKSSYNKMNCKDMIIKYKTIIEEFKNSGNEELLLWKDTNDPIYKFCYEKHTAVFDSLEKVENSLFQDDQY